MRFSRLSTLALSHLALLVPIACHNNSGEEVYQNSSGAINEADIRGSLNAGTVDLEFPIHRGESGTLRGVLTASLVDVSKAEEPVLATATSNLSQTAELEAHTLQFFGLPADLAREKTAPMAIRWRIALTGGELRGSKSLYAALGQLELVVRGAAELLDGTPTPFRVITRDAETGAARQGVDVRITLRADVETGAPAATPVELFSGKTDALGEAVARLSLPQGIDSGSLEVRATTDGAEAWSTSAVHAVHDRRLALSLDKTIYKPGQTLMLRTLAVSGAGKAPVAGEEVTFEALDAKGNKVFRRRATTDAFGVASMQVVTDGAVNEGVWTLRALMSGAKTEQKVPVTRYNLPKMKVSVSADKEFATIGEAVHGKIDTRYVFGLPVVGAQVALTLKTGEGAVLSSASLTTDASGAANYTLPLVDNGSLNASDLADGKLAVTVEAKVTDSAGQNETGAKALPLVNGALVIKALAESGSLIPGVENLIYLLVSDPVGRPLVASLNVTGAGPMRPLTTDQDGVVELRFTPSGQDPVDLTVTAVDGAQRTATRSLHLEQAATSSLLVRTDKAVYRAGETAILRIDSNVPGARVFLDVFRGSSGIDTVTATTDGAGHAELQLPIAASMKGLVALDAFLIDTVGTMVHGTQRLLVDPEDRLDIQLRADKSTYAPGEDTAVQVSVTDSQGRPAVASLGLTAVDEAVFALGGEPNQDLRSAFNLDARVLPGSVSVLGRAPSDLLSTSGAAQDRLARLLFASAKGAGSPALEYDSTAVELPSVIASLTQRVSLDAVSFLKRIAPGLKGKMLTPDLARLEIEFPANGVLDPFGRHYKATIDPMSPQYLKFVSPGPDERIGTRDDVSAQIWFGWVTWADADQLDAKGDFRGGFDNGFGAPQAAAEGDANHGVPVPPVPQVPGGGGTPPAKVRSDFRETVYANPTLITDASGHASVSFPLADSITTWRIRAEGSTKDGKLGAGRLGVRTFQEFFVDFDVPLSLTQGDTIELPAVVYNYLATPQTVSVRIDSAPWFELLSAAEQSVALEPSEVRAVKFKIRAKSVGTQELSIHGSAGAITDALVRSAEVKPDGVPEAQSFSDKLTEGSRSHTVSIPADAIAGGTELILSLTPGFAGEAVHGVEALLKEPGGCFEQTTSSAWPNTLVTTYLEATGQLTPELKEKAFSMVTRGYQRLVTFESPTGGINWWGNADPGNRILSSIMLWHLKDMEGIIETDNAFKQRTLTWLLQQQQADGSWASGDALHAGNEILGTSAARTTAFIAWALAHTGWADDAVNRAMGYLRAHPADDADLYATALSANAFAAANASDPALSTLLDKIDRVKHDEGDGRLKWSIDVPSWTGGAGNEGAIETTSLIAYGMMKANAYNESAAGAMRFLVANKDAVGSWYNTQATMNALRALLAAASPRGSDAEGTLNVTVNGQAVAPFAIHKADGDLLQKLDLTQLVRAGDNTVTLSFTGAGSFTYQLARKAYRPGPPASAVGPLKLSVSYDTTAPNVGDSVLAHVAAEYDGSGTRDQVIVRVGRAPGMQPRTEDLDRLVSSGAVARYEVDNNLVTFYLMNMRQGEVRDLSFHSTATLAIEGQAPPSVVYAYYQPSLRMELAPVAFSVAAR
ncbi:MAG: alpha-2-macroglobulin family protein [Myxococcota bacterium]